MIAYDSYYTSSDTEDADIVHSARITSDQIGAIATWLDSARLIEETRKFIESQKRKPVIKTDVDVIRKWLTNAWSTEFFLASITDDFGPDVKAYAVHWAFPQAYYAVYGQRMAYSIVHGYQEDSHQKVIRRFGNDALELRLPASLAICVTGTKNNYEHHNIAVIDDFTTDRRLRRVDHAMVAGYVGSALRGTRGFDLDRLRRERAKEFVTSKGKPTQKLNREQWQSIAKNLGPTSLMSFLYRKRLKANYDNVDALHSDVIDANNLLSDIRCIVNAFALVHESLILFRMGRRAFEEMIERAPKQVVGMFNARKSDVLSCGCL